MKRSEKIRAIKGILSGLDPLGYNAIRVIEVWFQVYPSDEFLHFTTRQSLSYEQLMMRKNLIGSSQVVVVEFTEGKTIL